MPKSCSKTITLSIGTDCGPAHVAGFEGRNAICLTAAFGNAPYVCKTVAVAIAHEVNETVASPHGPRIEAIEVSDLGKLLRADVHYHDVALIRAAIKLAPVSLRLLVIGETLSVR